VSRPLRYHGSVLRIVRAISLIIACVGLSAGSRVRNDAWTVIGPGGGGAQFYPAVSPHDSNFVVVGSDMTGTYLTRDGGKNWRMINLRGVPRFFVFDPSDPKTLYAQTIGLWRSTDAGTTWDLVVPDPRNVTGISAIDDHGEEEFQTTTGAGSVVALAVDPKDSHTLFAVFSAGGRQSLRRSNDWGRSWAAVGGEIPARSNRLYIDPDSSPKDPTVYVVGTDRVAVLAGGSLRSGPGSGGMFVDASVGFPGHGAKAVIYGAARSAVYVSRDGGATWVRTTPAQRLQAIATSLSHPNVAYVSFGSMGQGQPRSFGVARTTDFGATWSYPWKEAEKKAPNVDDGWVSARFGPGWGENPLTLAVAPGISDICYATDLGRTLRSLDGGATWTATYTRRTQNGDWTTTGLDVTTNYGVHFDPFNPKHVFIGYTDIGLFGSDDGGSSWHSSTVNGVPREWLNTTYWVAFDPDVRGRLWAVMSGTHDLPRPKMWRRASPSSYKGGVVRSDDGGKTWRAMTGGMQQTAATHILLDPHSKPDARILYVTGFGKGVFRSGDGGKTWEARNTGLPAPEPLAWRLAQDRDGVLYVILARRSDDGSIGTDRDGFLYRSRNAGESWEKIPLPPGVNGPNGLAIDPADPKRLYLAAWRRNIPDAAGGGGIYVSADAGVTWRQVLSKNQHIYDVTIDSRDKSVLYACGFESSAWRSTDRGESWQRIRGYNFKWGHRVIPDPRDASMIFVTTFGGSVWHGPAAGDPKAAEDIVTPVAAFTR
jgi:photosystem II stability/assembly factor-like uncharacterized protein